MEQSIEMVQSERLEAIADGFNGLYRLIHYMTKESPLKMLHRNAIAK